MLRLSSLARAAAAVQDGSTSCEALVAQCHEKAQRHAGLNAFITETWDDAVAAARDADRRRARGAPRSAIDGLPVAVKDNFCTADVRTTAASRMLEGARRRRLLARCLDGLRSLTRRERLRQSLWRRTMRLQCRACGTRAPAWLGKPTWTNLAWALRARTAILAPR